MSWPRVLSKESPRAVESTMRSDLGRVRDTNEDAVTNFRLRFWHGARAFAVADGMGGYSGGEVASKAALERFEEELNSLPKVIPSDPHWQTKLSANLQGAVQEVADHVARLSAIGEGLQGMGTTLVALLILDEWACVVHVGDSRAYRLRDGILQQLTIDHTWGEDEIIKQGGITQAVLDAPQRDHLVRSIGRGGDSRATVLWHRIRQGDLFLLCSDGLTAYLDGEELAAALSDNLNIQEKADACVSLANHRGGADNISLVLIQVLHIEPGSLVSPTAQTLDPTDFSAQVFQQPRTFLSPGRPPWRVRGNRTPAARLIKVPLALGLLLAAGSGASLLLGSNHGTDSAAGEGTVVIDPDTARNLAQPDSGGDSSMVIDTTGNLESEHNGGDRPPRSLREREGSGRIDNLEAVKTGGCA